MGSALLDRVNAAYAAMGDFYASDWAALEARNEGLYVCSGCALSASGSAGKLDMSAGTIFAGTTELNVTAVTASSTTITSLADGTNPKWVAVEIDSSGVLQFNQGTAAAAPVKPALTANRVLVAWLYVPASATAVDALLSTANGKAKIIDARQLMTVHPERLVFQDTASTGLSNPAALTTLLASTYPIPANSLSVGDTIEINASGRFVPGASVDTTVQWVLSVAGVSMLDFTTATLTKAGNTTDTRGWTMHLVLTVRTIGASANFEINGWLAINAVAALSAGVAVRLTGVGGAAAGDMGIVQGVSSNFDSTAAATVDFKATRGASATNSIITLRQFDITKRPV